MELLTSVREIDPSQIPAGAELLEELADMSLCHSWVTFYTLIRGYLNPIRNIHI